MQVIRKLKVIIKLQNTKAIAMG